MLPGRHHVNAMSVNDAGNFNDPASFLLVATEAPRQCVAVSNLQELLSFLYFSLLALMTSHEAKHGKTWQNPLESAWSMHCHCFSPFLPWQSAQTYQLQSWQGWQGPISAISPVARPNGMTRLATEGHRFGFFCFSTVTSFILFLGCLAAPAFKEHLEHAANSEDSWNVSCLRTTGSTHELNQVNPRPPCTFHTPTAGLGEALCSRRKPLGLCGTVWRSSVTWSKRLRRQPNSAGVVWNMTPSSDASDLSSFSFYPVRQWWQVQPVQYFSTLIVFLTLIQSFQGGGPSQDQPPLSAFHLQMDPELVQLDQCQKKLHRNRRKNYEKSPAHLERFDAPDSPWPTLRR